jgi:hypothetical protein
MNRQRENVCLQAGSIPAGPFTAATPQGLSQPCGASRASRARNDGPCRTCARPGSSESRQNPGRARVGRRRRRGSDRGADGRRHQRERARPPESDASTPSTPMGSNDGSSPTASRPATTGCSSRRPGRSSSPARSPSAASTTRPQPVIIPPRQRPNGRSNVLHGGGRNRTRATFPPPRSPFLARCAPVN